MYYPLLLQKKKRSNFDFVPFGMTFGAMREALVSWAQTNEEMRPKKVVKQKRRQLLLLWYLQMQQIGLRQLCGCSGRMLCVCQNDLRLSSISSQYTLTMLLFGHFFVVIFDKYTLSFGCCKQLLLKLYAHSTEANRCQNKKKKIHHRRT